MADNLEIAAKLDEARSIIAKGWCQGDYALDEAGRPTNPVYREAARFCPLGAIGRVTVAAPAADEIMQDWLSLAIRPTRAGLPGQRIWRWNDRKCRTQAEVVEAFRKAAELARASA